MENKSDTKRLIKNAVGLGTISIFSYLASYFLRNLLSVATPVMQGDMYTVEWITVLSSAYMLTYAMGQLLNGTIGDLLNPKYMIVIGLCLAGVATFAFPFMPLGSWVQAACFVVMGFGLSMLRGPIMKMVAENMPKNYSRTVCTFLNVASFAGPLVASAFAMIFQEDWKWMFTISGGITLIIAVTAFITLTVFEKKKVFVFTPRKGSFLKGYLQLFKMDNFVFYLIAGGVVEIAGTAITFWTPLYLEQELGFDLIQTNVLYSVISVITALAPFISLAVFKLVGERDIAMMRGGFLIAVAAFLLMLLPMNPWLKVLLFLIAKLSLACCSGVLWSIYIPGMGSTGKVSGINGIINCIGYLSAAVANAVFGAILGLSWSSVICIWCGIAAVGLLAALILGKTRKRAEEC